MSPLTAIRTTISRPTSTKPAITATTWSKITTGIPDGVFVRAVREDPKKKGLLYAGTERGVFVSFDDGAHWRSMQLNLPITPIHDLVVKNDDLVLATHGRSFWILDDVSPLRQFADSVAREDMHLYQPATAYRVHTAMLEYSAALGLCRNESAQRRGDLLLLEEAPKPDEAGSENRNSGCGGQRNPQLFQQQERAAR